MSLLEIHRPWLRFDSRELYAPCAVEAMTDVLYTAGPGRDYGCELKRRDPNDLGRVIVLGSPETEPPFDAQYLGRTYPTGRAASELDFLDSNNLTAVADSRAWLRANESVVYGRETGPTEDGRRWLQYWFFYYFNGNRTSRGPGEHEADWEMIQIGLGDNEQPAEMTYARHGKGEKVPWDEALVEIVDNGPVVYVAYGSHACLPSVGRHQAPVFNDYCNGEGKTIRPRLLDISMVSEGWICWPGLWGGSRNDPLALEFASPPSPGCQEAWQAGKFHGQAAEFGELRFGLFSFFGDRREPIGVPEVSVDSTFNTVSVGYRVPGASPGDWVAELRIWVRREGEEIASEHVFDVTGKALAEIAIGEPL